MATTVWKGHLTFGLVAIPVRMFKAARAERISLHQLHRSEPAPAPTAQPTLVPEPTPERTRSVEQPEAREAAVPEVYTRVRHQLVAPGASAAPEPVAPAEIVKGYEYEKNRYVTIDAEDLKKIAPKTGTEMRILEFVKLDEIDPIYFETSYYLAPDEAGEKAYALLFEAMRETKFVALAEVAMHRRDHVVVLRPGMQGLIAHTMFFADEIRKDQDYRAPTESLQPKELQLAKQLIASLEATFEPHKYKDEYREKLRALIDARLAGKQVAEAPEPRKPAEVVDILAALQASLKSLKKPAAAEPAKPPVRKRAGK